MARPLPLFMQLIAKGTLRAPEPRTWLPTCQLQAQYGHELHENIRLRSAQIPTGYRRAEKWAAGLIQGREMGFACLPEESEKYLRTD
jgi:hypothetical protein